eukprot:TRINITY_DN10359_c0_g1_i2.p1 TRINITY_DN10359_c0_g1~~TRINITY_DN10359_c0_g1_i2.p1  ORF type:complete len:392 (+),score=96.27 TRINITY_DN10359_c0_g1_i2:238-1413(+)
MAMKVFHEERVDCVVMEVGIGGRFDSTNFLQSAVACGITTLDYDHTQILGETLAKIAYEKAGIMKRGVPVIVTPQVDEAQDVIVSTAVEVGARLFLAAPLASYGHEAATLGLQALYQELNAALAIALAHTWLSSKTQSEDQISLFTGNGCTSVSQKNLDQQFPTFPLSPAYVTGFMNTKWPGRAQVLRMQDGYPNVTFYIDGAHTIQSIKQCLLWFQANEQFTHAVRILCFNCKPDKDIESMLALLHTYHVNPNDKFDHIFFPSNKLLIDRTKNDGSCFQSNTPGCGTELQDLFKSIWHQLSSSIPVDPTSSSTTTTTTITTTTNVTGCLRVPSDDIGKQNETPITFTCVNDVLGEISKIGQQSELPVHVLVTGSLYLVGSFLHLLQFDTC